MIAHYTYCHYICACTYIYSRPVANNSQYVLPSLQCIYSCPVINVLASYGVVVKQTEQTCLGFFHHCLFYLQATCLHTVLPSKDIIHVCGMLFVFLSILKCIELVYSTAILYGTLLTLSNDGRMSSEGSNRHPCTLFNSLLHKLALSLTPCCTNLPFL